MEDQVVEHLAAARILHHQVQSLLRLYHLEHMAILNVRNGLFSDGRNI